MSYTVIITEEIAANVDVTTQNYPITIEYNATNVSDGGGYGNANVANYLASGNLTANIITTGGVQSANVTATGFVTATGNVLGANFVTGGLVTATGNVQGGNLRTAGQVTATGNITGANIIGNGQYLTNLTAANVSGTVANATYATSAGTATTAGTANVALVANSVAGANVSGEVANAAYATSAGSATTATTAGTANIALVAYSVAAANVSGTVANATYATSAGSATTAGTVTGNAQANITSVGTLTSLSVSGNITGGNVIAPNFLATNSAGGTLKNSGGTTQASWGAGGGDNFAISVSTNINGANAQVDISPTGSGHVHIKPTGTGAVEIAPSNLGSINNMLIGNVTPAAVSATTVSASGNVTGGNLITAGLITASGNITGGNVLSAGNLQSTQQTVVGTANVGTTGNIVISGKNIATDMAWSPDGGNAATGATGRIVVGTGFAGNITHSAQQNRFVVADSINRSNTATNARHFGVETFVNLTGNVVQNGFRQQGMGAFVRVGGGSLANTMSSSGSGTTGVPFMLAAGQFNLDVGNTTPYNLGNTTVSHATINGGALQLAGASNVGNAYGVYNLVGNVFGTTTTGTYGNIIGYSTSMTPPVAPTGNVYGFFHGSNVGAHNIQTNNSVRQAPQYYAFYNQDDHAHVQAGSLRAYHEYRGDLATTGTVDINKVNGQTQYIRPTGNVTIGSFTNFVTETTDGSTFDQQIDTVTLVIAQGATPYTITMPPGNAAIKYAGNVSTVANTANAVTMISISAANIASTKTYMVTISPEFV
jgi:filamentous hemagglutinin